MIEFEREIDFERMVRRFLQKVCFDVSDKIAKKKSKLSSPLVNVERLSYEDVEDYILRKVCAVSDYNSTTSKYLSQDKAQDLLSLIENHERLVLLSDAGAGKTTELKRLAAYYSRKESPFYPYWGSLNKYVNQSIPELLPTSWSQVPEEQLLIILDGLDEIESKNKNDAIRQIELFSENHPTSHVIVSCRANFYNTEVKNLSGTLSRFSSYVLLDLAKPEIEEYVKSKLGSQSQVFYNAINYEHLDSLLGIPFYLIRLVKLFSEASQLPQSKAELFEDLLVARFELDKNHYRTTIELNEKRENIIGTLEQIALVMESLGRNYISDSEYRAIIPDESVRELVKYCTAWKREKEEPAKWQFEHNNFQEYLAARMLSRQPLEVIKSFLSFAPNHCKIIPTWANTLSFLVSILDRDCVLLDELLKWILEIEPELAVKFEVDRLDNETRIRIFTEIFNEYKEKKIYIDRHKYEHRDLARFGQSDQVCEFLISEVENPGHVTTLVNAIELLRYSNIPSSQKPQVISLLMNYSLNESEEYIQNRALLAMADLGLNSQEVVKQVVARLRSSKSEWVRYGLYYFLYNSDYLDDYIDIFLDGIKYTLGDTNRLMDEFWHLSVGLEKVSSPEAIIQILAYYESHPEELHTSYGSSHRNILATIVKKAADNYPAYPSIFDSVFNLTMSLIKKGAEKEADALNPFFDATQTRVRAFQQVFSQRSNIEEALMIQAFLANNDCLEFFAQEYVNRNITNDDVWLFQHYLGSLNFNLYLAFNELINKKSGNKFILQPSRNIKEERKLRREQGLNLLFDKPAFITELKAIFDREDKNSFTKEDLLNIKVKNRGGEYFSELAYRTLFRMADGQAVSDKPAIDWLDRNWEWFSISNLYEYLSNDPEINLSSSQVEWIAKWCYQHIDEVDFKTALNSDKRGSSSASFTAIWLWFFLRKFDLEFPKTTLLDLVSFDWIEGHQLAGISYLEDKLSQQEMADRIIENLKAGINSNDILKNHIDYCKRHSINEVIPFALNTIRDKTRDIWVREVALDTVEELSRSLSDLELLLPEITDEFKWKLFERLIRKECTICISYLREILQSGDEQEQVKAAIFLIELQDLEGLKYYVDLVEKEKRYIGGSYDKSPLKPIRTIEAIPLLIRLLTVSYQENFTHHEFYRIDQAVLNSLETVALQSDEAYHKVRNSLLQFIKEMSEMLESITFLYVFIDNLERSYYTRKSQNLSLDKAISNVNSLTLEP